MYFLINLQLLDNLWRIYVFVVDYMQGRIQNFDHKYAQHINKSIIFFSLNELEQKIDNNLKNSRCDQICHDMTQHGSVTTQHGFITA